MGEQVRGTVNKTADELTKDKLASTENTATIQRGEKELNDAAKKLGN